MSDWIQSADGKETIREDTNAVMGRLRAENDRLRAVLSDCVGSLRGYRLNCGCRGVDDQPCDAERRARELLSPHQGECPKRSDAKYPAAFVGPVGPRHHGLEAATPPAILRAQIMDSSIPKNEREWWAAREIEQLQTKNLCLYEACAAVWAELADSNDPRLRPILDEVDAALTKSRTQRLTQPTPSSET